MDYMEFKNEDEAKRVAPFRPSGSSSQVRGTWAVRWHFQAGKTVCLHLSTYLTRTCMLTQAKDAVKVDYFLNSPDAESKTYELRATRQRGKEMKESFMRQTKDRRGQTFV